MTDDHQASRDGGTTPDEDELVSAVLDGVATDEERARVASDPRLTARLEAFGSVRSVLGSPAPERTAPAVRQAGEHTDHRRDSGSRRGGRPLVWAGAAAAALVLVVAGAGILVSTPPGGGDDEAASTAADAERSTSGASTSTATDDGRSEGDDLAASGAIPTTTGPVGSAPESAVAGGGLADLGAWPSVDALAEVVTALPVPAPMAPGPCPAPFDAAGALAEATATVGGTAVVVGRGGSGVLVVELGTCRPLT